MRLLWASNDTFEVVDFVCGAWEAEALALSGAAHPRTAGRRLCVAPSAFGHAMCHPPADRPPPAPLAQGRNSGLA
jgi:hypothetical protein